MRTPFLALFFLFSACKPHHQHGNVGGVDPRDTSRLAEIKGTDAIQLFARFQPQALDFVVIEVGGEKLVFQLLGALDLLEALL